MDFFYMRVRTPEQKEAYCIIAVTENILQA